MTDCPEPVGTMVQSTNSPNSQQLYRGGVRVYKIVILGTGGVGKSALTQQFVSHSFLDCHDPTIEDAYQQQCVVDGEAALLDILDTAGQVEFTAMREQYMRGGEGFVICYSITDRRSFEDAAEYVQLVRKVRITDDIPIVLVGNKCDLNNQRKVSTEEGQVVARQLGCPLFETSAALRHFVDEVFHTLVRNIRRRERTPNGANGKRQLQRTSKWRRLRNVMVAVFQWRRARRML